MQKNIFLFQIDGTQDIFYERNDVFFCSLHGDPHETFPHFLGYQDEVGRGPGFGFNINFPMPAGTEFVDWKKSFDNGLSRIKGFAPAILVISLGVDTFEGDPISFFNLKTDDYKIIGHMISELEIPTLFVMEGGYDIGEIGINTVNVLIGFQD